MALKAKDVKLVKKLKIKLLATKQLMEYAEEKVTTDPSIKPFLHKLKDAVYNAEDLLDVISTLDHTYKMETTLFNRLTCKLPWIIRKNNNKLPSSWNPFDVPIHQELHNVLAGLESLLEQRDVLGLTDSNPSSSRLERLPTTSIEEEESSPVYGRDEDKEEIKKILLCNDGSTASAIAIVGMGGIGKTTLAQLLYNDSQIDLFFKPNKVWICVSEYFDVVKITKTILEKLTSQSYATNDFDELQMKLKETLLGKRFLIFLDDVWNQNSKYWDNLRRPFGFAAPESKIIITTRTVRVAHVMHAMVYQLRALPAGDCWWLFTQHAFQNIQSDAHSTFIKLGKELVKKCRGHPLAAKLVGGLVGTKLGYQEWEEILRSEIWDLGNEILPALMLSYHYLPSNLKRCFVFCSIVPKDFDFEKEKLVLLWMAENLLQNSKSKRRIEVGYDYLRDLESRSLIEPSTPGCFRMHDLVNDFAKSVSGGFYKSFDNEVLFNVGQETRHFSYVVTRDDYEYSARVKEVSEAKRLRTFLSLSPQWIPSLHPILGSEIWTQLNVLRSLILARTCIEKLADSIGNLKLLQHLDLSENPKLNELPECLASLYNLAVLNLGHCSSLTKLPENLASLYNLEMLNLSGCKSLTMLPESLASLFNLEVLILSGCKSLTKLPSKLRQLINLKHLNISSTKLCEMPLQMGRLKDLNVLTDFVVGKESGSSIGELKGLNDLRGELRIHGLQNITDPKDALVANLNGKSWLKELDLVWNIDHDNSEDATIILENLKPHVSLEKLYIENYSGKSLPKWSGNTSFTNLVSIELYYFKQCFDLSPLGQLPSLTSLTIYRCDSLVKLIDHDVGHFSKLVYLKISDCPKLELPQHHRFTSIEKFILQDGSCASLEFFSLSLFPNLKELHLEDVQSIESLAIIDEVDNFNLEYLEAIEITNCPNLEYFSEGKWCAPRTTYLKFHNCESLKVLPENMCDIFPSLESLSLNHCPNLEALPQSGLPGNLRTLEIIGSNKLIANRSRWGLQKLLSLSTLYISQFTLEFEDLKSFPEEGLLPSSLSSLLICNVPNLGSLNGNSFQLLTSLKALQLRICPKLQCLPELPTSLSSLLIAYCPLLESRCKEEQGEDWSKIAHIANRNISSCLLL